MRQTSPETMHLFSTLLALSSLLIASAPHVAAKPAPTLKAASPKAATSPAVEQTRLPASEAYGKLPLSFERNQGQTNARVKYLSRGPGYTLLLTATEAVLRLSKPGERVAADSATKSAEKDAAKQKAGLLRMKMLGANPAAKIAGENELQGKSNYLIGNDRKKWRTNVPRFTSVRYSEVYPGIDLVYFGTNQRQLEYDFRLAPNVDPSSIKLAFDGAEQMVINEQGELVLRLKGGEEVVQRAPQIYQEAEGSREQVAGRYVLKGEREVGFEIGEYDRSKLLVIDPQLIYATYYGGAVLEIGNDITVDRQGNAYITGATLSSDLPLKNPFQNQLNRGASNFGPILKGDAFVVKFNSNGTDILYATYLGGGLDDQGLSIAVTNDGKACVTGSTNDQSGLPGTNNFPVTSNALQTTQGGRQDAFVTVISGTGDSLVYSTFLRGSSDEHGEGIAVDALGKIYVTGITGSADFPTKNGFQPTIGFNSDAFITKLDPSLAGSASLLYSTFVGGNSLDFGTGIALDSAGNAYVCGETFSTNFPVLGHSNVPPLQGTKRGGLDGFITKINPNTIGNNSLIYSTYFGGDGDDTPKDIAVQATTRRAFITGRTTSNASTFPLRNAFDSTFEGDTEGFVASLSDDGTQLFYSSFIGGGDQDDGRGIAVDAAGNAYVTGRTHSTSASLPSVNPFPSSAGGLNGTMLLAKIEATASPNVTPRVLYLSKVGAPIFGSEDGTQGQKIALDPKGNVYVTGMTSRLLEATPGAFQTFGHVLTSFAIKTSSTFPDTVGLYDPSPGVFTLRNSNSAGPTDIFYDLRSFIGTTPFDIPLAGDWTGDGKDEVGIYRNGAFFLAIPIIVPGPDGQPTQSFGIIFASVAGAQSTDKPVVGDWNGDGIDTIGVFRDGRWLLSNSNTSSAPVAFDFNFGQAGDQPIASDSNGDGKDGVGVFRPATGQFLLDENNIDNTATAIFNFGTAGDLAFAGDWNGDGVDGVGVFRPSTGTFFLNNTLGNFATDVTFNFGQAGDIPLVGDWDGRPADTPPDSGVNDPSQGSSRVGQVQVFTTTCSDPDGWHDIHTIDFKIAKGKDKDEDEEEEGGNDNDDGGPLILWVQFDENSNRIRFYDPDLQVWREGAPGAGVVLQSRFAQLRLAGTTITGSGPTGPSVHVRWEVVFKDDAVGNNYKQFLKITDDAGASTGFDHVGSWSVKQ